MTGDSKLEENPHYHYDNHGCHVWMLEVPTSQGVLTEDGLDQIVHHKYKAGTYTALDSFLNPFWQYCTDQLPLWLAPNAITAFGGLCTIISYWTTAQYSFDMTASTASVPNWTLLFNGICLVIYYTVDCMDGKQARRTNSSSPMGQLFDHGVDCVTNLSHLSLLQAMIGFSDRPFLMLQWTMQYGFFQAQLEEYYTGSLPHATGNFGTTEVIYGMAVASIISGIWGLLETILTGSSTRDAYYSQPLPSALGLQKGGLASYFPYAADVLGRAQDDVVDISPLQLREAMLLVWFYGFMVLLALSLTRITYYIFFESKRRNEPTYYSKWHLFGSCLSKAISPLIIFGIALQTKPLSSDLGGIRYPSLAMGLCFCIITIKLVVLGMARMAYASFQWVDLVPLMIVAAIQQDQEAISESFAHASCWIRLMYPLAALAYTCRLVWWTRHAVGPLCERLKIRLFRIPYPVKDKDI